MLYRYQTILVFVALAAALHSWKIFLFWIIDSIFLKIGSGTKITMFYFFLGWSVTHYLLGLDTLVVIWFICLEIRSGLTLLLLLYMIRVYSDSYFSSSCNVFPVVIHPYWTAVLAYNKELSSSAEILLAIAFPHRCCHFHFGSNPVLL